MSEIYTTLRNCSCLSPGAWAPNKHKQATLIKREAEAAAKLHHTNIVPIDATGESDGTHFYAMELIGGSSLDKVMKQARDGVCRRAPPPPNRRRMTPPFWTPKAVLANPGPKTSARNPDATTSLGEGNSYFDPPARRIADIADALDYAHQQRVIHCDQQ